MTALGSGAGGVAPWLCALLAVVFLPGPAVAQGPAAEWRTLETAHYRFLFPEAAEPWARRAAARVEAVRERVAAEVGYAPPQKVDVLVVDPVASPNGMALPLLDRPRLVLFTTPPPPDLEIGHSRDWAELLLVHEQAHLAHLLRPSRNPVRRGFGRVLPVGPIALAAPRWATEGYATVVEGRLTGSGRPHGDLRAAILRRRALAGRLPGYGALSRDDDSWLGGAMAYLAGSAFLEWLEEHAGPGSLPRLWRRMTARETRDFDAAFRGVFGEGPGDLYGRFSAELTHRAVEAERRIEASAAGAEPRRPGEAAPGGREGEPWLDLSRGSGAPALAPGGDRLAAVRRERDRPAQLVVWSTAPDEEAGRRREERLARLLERDPEDVPPVETGPPPRKRLHTLALDPAPAMPRFLPGGEALLFVRFVPDREGFLHPDLFRWRPAAGGVERITHGADLRDPDPSPDGAWAVANRIRHGLSQLVRVDLASGDVEALTEPAFAPIDRPRLSPDGRRAAFARQVASRSLPRSSADAQSDNQGRREDSQARREDSQAASRVAGPDTGFREDLGGGRSGWELVVRDLATGEETRVLPPPGGSAWHPTWSPDGGTLYASVGRDGFIDLWAFPLDPPGPPQRLTRTVGAALAPEAAPDGKALFYLSLDAEGLDIFRLELPPPLAARSWPPLETADLVPAVPPPPAEVSFPTVEDPGPSRPYGPGRPEAALLSSGAAGSSGDAWDLGVRLGDVVGRWELLALGGSGGAGPRGGALAGAWRGWPVEVGFHLFAAEERPSRPSGTAPGAAPGRQLDADRRGAEVSAAWLREQLGGRLAVEAALYAGEIDPLGDAALGIGGETLDQRFLSLAAEWRGRRRLGRWTLAPAARLRWDAGATGGDAWNRRRAGAALGLSHAETGDLSLSWSRGAAHEARHAWDRFQVGGTASSLLPESLLGARVLAPALPAGTLLGEEFESQRVELALDALPLPLFAERHRVAAAAGGWGGWLRIAGVEWRLGTPPLPIAGLPALDLRLGAARVLDPPFEDDDRWWLTLVLRP